MKKVVERKKKHLKSYVDENDEVLELDEAWFREASKSPHFSSDDLSVSVILFIRERASSAGGPAALALRVLRKQRGLTQKNLSKMVGLLPAELSLMERGKRRITFVMAKRLAKPLGCKWQELASSVLSQNPIHKDGQS